jgi:hypothetical protein
MSNGYALAAERVQQFSIAHIDGNMMDWRVEENQIPRLKLASRYISSGLGLLFGTARNRNPV